MTPTAKSQDSEGKCVGFFCEALPPQSPPPVVQSGLSLSLCMVTEMQRRREGMVCSVAPPDGQPASSPLRIDSRTSYRPNPPRLGCGPSTYMRNPLVRHGGHPRVCTGARLLVRRQRGAWDSSWKRSTVLGERCAWIASAEGRLHPAFALFSFARPVRWADQPTPRAWASRLLFPILDL